MLIPVLAFVVASLAGSWASAQWLPNLARGSVGGLAFFLVCGLWGAALGTMALHVYLIVRELETAHEAFGAVDVAEELRLMAFDAGSLTALASIVYLLAPAPEADEEMAATPAAS